eukprot:9470951-Pyramimonas_sp.AAC.1
MVWIHDGGACHEYMKLRQLMGSSGPAGPRIHGRRVCRGPSMAESRRACEAHICYWDSIGSLYGGYMTEGHAMDI